MEYMLTFHILNVYVDKTQPRQFKFTFKTSGLHRRTNCYIFVITFAHPNRCVLLFSARTSSIDISCIPLISKAVTIMSKINVIL